ncbi:hypothetical protein Pogu_1234 [Pyrobaculum oguniense TE7]|uniref:Uncharacterized protein n=1 Tax=Pyrobaculum oguniense (strain DSM 13380 / JCM 10595 / TE7) TaxID=698757 RepID=H6Q8V6_PYROT|nr:hypothetical protein Pogu_1234 [Pyrobaculum oguniense TE7]
MSVEEVMERVRELWERFERRKLAVVPRGWPRGVWARRFLEEGP